MIDSIDSLAFSIQANRGVYALLLGSGISKAANIPTGWEITLDLVRKLANPRPEQCEPSPEQWYRDRFGKEAEYSYILKSLAKTRAERQQLLRPYWEPNAQEKEEGKKQPTKAHRAIAKLVAQGFIKVIITTNFDRLIENAITEAGVVPKILSSSAEIEGALPLIHTKCCVFKVNGDYMDTRIRNTSAELNKYPPKTDKLLRRIFDEFGLIVCGWSANWDNALRDAILKTKTRRFTTYWAVHGDPSDEAKRLIQHRDAQTIKIENADCFFQTIQQRVTSIEKSSQPHPLSTEAAVASLKHYMSESKHRIKFSDLIDSSVNKIIETISNETSVANEATSVELQERLQNYESTCSTLIAMAITGGYWVEEWHYPIWRHALENLANFSCNSSYPILNATKHYPAALLFYALGLGAIKGEHLRFLNVIFTAEIRYLLHRQSYYPAVQMLPAERLFGNNDELRKILRNHKYNDLFLSVKLRESLQQYTRYLSTDNNLYQNILEKLEILIALRYKYHRKSGDFILPLGYEDRRNSIERFLQKIKDSINGLGSESPYVKYCMGSSDCGENLITLDKFSECCFRRR